MKKTIISTIVIGLSLCMINISLAGTNTINNFENLVTHYDETEYWAVLLDINPGPYGEIAIVKDCLLFHGFNEDHIKTLFEVTYNDAESAFTWLAENTDENDIVLISSNTHGMDGYILLSDCNLYYTEIDEWMDQLNVKGIFYSISACHSGSAIPILGEENRVIATACRSNESGGTAWFLVFLFCNYDAVGYYGFEDAPSPNGAFYRRDCDLNADGWISVEEAFIYAEDWTKIFHNEFWIQYYSSDDPIQL